MYRNLFTLLLCISTVLAAPQKDSNITYVKKQVQSRDLQQELIHTSRESKIENLPLSIPGTYSNEDQKETTKNSSPSSTSVKDSEIQRADESTNDAPIYNYSDRIYSIKTKPKKNNKNNKNDKPVTPVEIVNDTEVSNLDISASNIETLTTTENSTLKFETDSDEAVTEKYEEEPSTTEVDIETTRAPVGRFSPKLSHYGKSSLASFSQNLIGTSGKRRFRSRCRCEKIWNCAKLQISVPRCPEEYFLCCG